MTGDHTLPLGDNYPRCAARIDWEGVFTLVHTLLEKPSPTSCSTRAIVDGRLGTLTIAAAEKKPGASSLLTIATGDDQIRASLASQDRELLADQLLWDPAEGMTIEMTCPEGHRLVTISASASPLDSLYCMGSENARKLKLASLRVEAYLSWSQRLNRYWPDNAHPLRVLPMPRPTFRSTDGSRTSFQQWTRAVANDALRVVARTNIGDGMVSTVYLGLDWRTAPSPAPPALFETGVAVFSGPASGFRILARHATLAEAEAYHAAAPGRVGLDYFFPALARPDSRSPRAKSHAHLDPTRRVLPRLQTGSPMMPAGAGLRAAANTASPLDAMPHGDSAKTLTSPLRGADKAKKNRERK